MHTNPQIPWMFFKIANTFCFNIYTSVLHRLIDWLYGVQHRFHQYFSFIMAASAPIHTFLGFFCSVLWAIFFPSYWLLSHMIIVKKRTAVREEWILLTIINPWKEYLLSRGSNQRPPVLKSANATEVLMYCLFLLQRKNYSKFNSLYTTQSPFYKPPPPNKKNFWKHCGKRRKCW